MRYYIVAGERSGDLHGSNLVKALNKLDTKATWRGFGGDYMQHAGVDLTVHYREMAIMGFIEFLLTLNKSLAYLKKCKQDIDDFNPDVIILIDYGGFNRRIAKYGKANGIRVFYYIPPKIWAWYQARAKEIKTNVDRLFVILPFEKDFYKRYNWEVDYVGNPVLDSVQAFKPDAGFMESLSLPADTTVIALLPGSRKQELISITPLLVEVIEQMSQYHFLVAGVDNLDENLYLKLRALSNVTIVYNKTYDILHVAQAAIVTSGTATLETSLFNVPQVVVYKPGALTYQLAKVLIKVPYISLVNLIADREVVRELIHNRANVVSVKEELNSLLRGSSRDRVMEGYKEVFDKLVIGGSASENTANLMWKYLNENGN